MAFFHKLLLFMIVINKYRKPFNLLVGTIPASNFTSHEQTSKLLSSSWFDSFYGLRIGNHSEKCLVRLNWKIIALSLDFNSQKRSCLWDNEEKTYLCLWCPVSNGTWSYVVVWSFPMPYWFIFFRMKSLNQAVEGCFPTTSFWMLQ